MSTLSGKQVRRDSFSTGSKSVSNGRIGDDRLEISGVPNRTIPAKSKRTLAYPNGSDEDVSTLIYSTDFAPSVGETESYAASLASAFAGWRGFRNGTRARLRDVTVVTQTPRGNTEDFQFPFRVVREPSLAKLFVLVRKAEYLIVIGADILPIAVGLLLRKIVAVEHISYLGVCPASNYVYQPDGVPCVGHFRNGNYGHCYRCQRVETNQTRSLSNLFLAIPRRWLLNRVAINIAPTEHTARRLALPHTETILHGIEDPLDKSIRPN